MGIKETPRSEASQFVAKDKASRDTREAMPGKAKKLKQAAQRHHERFVQIVLRKK